MEGILSKAVDQFITSQDGLGKEIKIFQDSKENFPNATIINNSIDRACKDMMARTLSVAEGQEKVKINEKIKPKLRKRIEDYFSSGENDTKEKFDQWHNDTCNTVLEILEGKYDNVQYGKAQKIVNMTFKYLYCFANDSERGNYFKFCHMPIDSTILEWIKRSEDKEIAVSKIPSWSNLEYSKDSHEKNKKYTYNKFRDDIRALVGSLNNENGMDLTPLEAEFIIWPNMQLYLLADPFLKQLDKNGNLIIPKDSQDPLHKILEDIKYKISKEIL